MTIIPLTIEYESYEKYPICILTTPTKKSPLFFFIDPKTDDLYFQLNNTILPFGVLPWEYMAPFYNLLQQDNEAYNALKNLPKEVAVEYYIKVAYGRLDLKNKNILKLL